MQGSVTELIRDLMKRQRLSIRKISAKIAQEEGGSELGYTQQINRILNDPDYDPNFSTVEKILTALNCSLWQTSPDPEIPIAEQIKHLDQRLDQISTEVASLRSAIADLQHHTQTLVQLSADMMAHLNRSGADSTSPEQ